MKNLRSRFHDYILGAFSLRRLWLLLWVLSMMSVIDVPGSLIFALDPTLIIPYIIGIGAMKATVIQLGLWWMMRRARLKPVAWMLISLYGAVVTVNAACYTLYGFGITRRLLTILGQTNSREIAGFLPGLWGNLLSLISKPAFIICLVSAVLTALFVNRAGRKLFPAAVSLLTVAGITFQTMFLLRYDFGRTANYMILRIPYYALSVYRSNAALSELESRKRPLPDAETVSSRHLARTMIVVIGESASRDHHSLYGYSSPTTPHLDAMADSLYIFRDALASASATAGNMERILTFKPDDTTYDDWYRFPLVVDLFRTAGYKCFWLSNQERTGIWANASGVLASGANVVKYVGAESSEDNMVTRLDEALLPEFYKAVTDTARCKLIFLHLIGSHTPYNSRYPSDRAYFNSDSVMRRHPRPWLNHKKASIVADYDNSIRYTDSVLSVIIKTTSKLPEPALTVYFSDHGEHVYDNSDFLGRDETTVRVPYLIYVNHAYSVEYPDMTGRLSRALQRPFSTANTIYQLMTLSGTSYSHYNGSDDILSDEFKPRQRLVNEQPWPYDTSAPKAASTAD